MADDVNPARAVVADELPQLRRVATVDGGAETATFAAVDDGVRLTTPPWQRRALRRAEIHEHVQRSGRSAAHWLLLPHLYPALLAEEQLEREQRAQGALLPTAVSAGQQAKSSSSDNKRLKRF